MLSQKSVLSATYGAFLIAALAVPAAAQTESNQTDTNQTDTNTTSTTSNSVDTTANASDVPGELMYGAGALILAIGLAGAVLWNRKRNPRNDRLSEQATREQYDHPETYAKRSEELKRKVEPS